MGAHDRSLLRPLDGIPHKNVSSCRAFGWLRGVASQHVTDARQCQFHFRKISTRSRNLGEIIKADVFEGRQGLFEAKKERKRNGKGEIEWKIRLLIFLFISLKRKYEQIPEGRYSLRDATH
jgi:hypothetical protein